jgi:hypothetical protein
VFCSSLDRRCSVENLPLVSIGFFPLELQLMLKCVSFLCRFSSYTLVILESRKAIARVGTHLLFIFCPTGPLSRSPCELLPVGVGHPVQALLKSFTAMSGCASRGTTGLPQEVHIINLRGHGPKGPDHKTTEVRHVCVCVYSVTTYIQYNV